MNRRELADHAIREASVHFQAGRLKKTESLFARACRLDPSDARSWYNRGTVSRMLGHHGPAEAAFREALRLDAAYDEARHNLGSVLAEQGRLEEAARCYEEILSRGPNVFSHCNLGNVRYRQGRFEEAMTHYRLALGQAPDDPELHNNLGSTYQQLHRHREAEAAYREALRLKPGFAAALDNLGALLLNMRRIGEAEQCYRSSLRITPGDRRALLGEAAVLEKQGRFEEAYSRLRPFLEPDQADAEAGLVFADLSRPLGRREEAIALLERLLAAQAPQVDARERLSLHFALGRLLDGTGQYDRAFDHYSRGNALAARPFDTQAHARHVDALIAAYDRDFMDRAPRAAGAGARMVFVLGMPRSGTSLVEQILASHPAVFGAGELDELQQLVTGLACGPDGGTSYPRRIGELTSRECEGLARRYLDHVARLAPPSAARVTDKMPGNFLHLGLIALLFPEARIIHCVRDPMDTALSCYFQNFGPGHGYANDLACVGFYYRHYRRLMDHWRRVIRLPVLEVRYEDLVADQEGTSRRLVEFCGLPWEERCLRFHETRRSVTTASYDQVRQPLYKHSAGRWRHYERHLAPMRDALSGLSSQYPDSTNLHGNPSWQKI